MHLNRITAITALFLFLTLKTDHARRQGPILRIQALCWGYIKLHVILLNKHNQNCLDIIFRASLGFIPPSGRGCLCTADLGCALAGSRGAARECITRRPGREEAVARAADSPPCLQLPESTRAMRTFPTALTSSMIGERVTPCVNLVNHDE